MDQVMAKFNSNRPVPLLLLGDAPDSTTGLGRIGHDLAWLTSAMPELKVGYMGREGFGRAKFPWAQYSFSAADQWGEQLIEQAWDDLSQGQRGIIFTVWDASRLLWFADGRNTGLERFLVSGRFERWGYFMADGSGVQPNRLPLEQAHVISRYQRALLASKWAYGLASGIQGPEIDWLPHPINRQAFRPQGRAFMRSAWNIGDRERLIGCVMTNQARKHWPVVMEALAHFGNNVRLWIHTDRLLHYWDLRALAVEYGLASRIVTDSRPLSDSELAMRYSACDATVVISGGEGFCYPVAESLSCGVPCVTGEYGAQAELTHWRVGVYAHTVDTTHNVRRAIYSPTDVFIALQTVMDMQPRSEECEGLVDHLDMSKLGLLWKRWLRKGLQ